MSNEVQYSHPNREPVGNLLQDAALWAVGDAGADFDAAIHGAGVHDEYVSLTAIEAILVQAEQAGELAHRRELAAFDALELDAEHVDNVDFADDLVEVVDYPGAELLERFGEQRRRADEDHLRTKLC